MEDGDLCTNMVCSAGKDGKFNGAVLWSCYFIPTTKFDEAV